MLRPLERLYTQPQRYGHCHTLGMDGEQRGEDAEVESSSVTRPSGGGVSSSEGGDGRGQDRDG